MAKDATVTNEAIAEEAIMASDKAVETNFADLANKAIVADEANKILAANKAHATNKAVVSNVAIEASAANEVLAAD